MAHMRLTEKELEALGLSEQARAAKLTPTSTRMRTGRHAARKGGRRRESPPERIMREWLNDYFPGGFIQNYRPKYTDAHGKVRQYEIDFAEPEAKVGIEIDGYTDHGRHIKGFIRDREKDLFHAEHGWDILRVTTGQVYNEMPRLIEWIRAKLGNRLPEG